MIAKRNYILALVLTCFYFTPMLSQNTVNITGKVLESNTNIPVEYATIAILDSDSKKAITGTITKEDGSFSLTTEASNFYIEISFIGYETKTISDFNLANRIIDLQTLFLYPVLTGLDEVIIRAETSQTRRDDLDSREASWSKRGSIGFPLGVDGHRSVSLAAWFVELIR